MKKIAAILMPLAVLVCFASCGGDTTDVSSEGASSVASTPASSTPNTVISIAIPSIDNTSSEEEIDSENLALLEGAEWFDMNDGLSEGDEGYKAYYAGDLGPHSLELAFNGNVADGWQMNDAPDGTGDMWIGVRFAEATAVDMIVLSWENGSKPETFGTSFKVEYSVDGEEWTEFSSETFERAEGDPVTVDTVSFDALEVKAVRVVLFEQGGSADKRYTSKLFELEIYAPVVEEGTESTESTDDTTAE